ncbi:MAG: hypothetical protein H0S85_04130 [Desulfovibrionaceae bacterium]|jgi:hypothetical protein|nr:hypothetical protein [Desulfovibrionaceae bacterium]
MSEAHTTNAASGTSGASGATGASGTPGERRKRLDEPRGVLDNLVFGVRVVLGEIKWLLLGGLRSFELRQLERRLDEERAALGAWVGERMLGPKPRKTMPQPDDEAWLRIRQIGFLQDEIALLRAERGRLRADLLERRREDLGS